MLATPRGRAAAAAVLAAVALLVVVGLSSDDAPPPPGTESADGRAPAEEPEVPRAVSELVDGMTTERKVAQLILVGLEGTGTDDPVLSSLEELDYVGVVIAERNYVSPEQVEDLVGEAASVADEAGHVTPWIMAPQEGGEFNALADLPPEGAPADLATAREAGSVAEETAEALLDLRVTGILGPVIDVGAESGGALGRRVFSDTPAKVRSYGVAIVEAFEEAGLFSAAKHFPGLGVASQSPELGPSNVGLSLDQLAERDLIPFEAAIEAGVPGIVVGHGLYGVDDFVTPASMSETIVTDLLRGELGFDGVAIADDLTAPAITGSFRTPAAAVDAVKAGVDMVYVSQGDEEQRAVFDALLEAVRGEEIPPERLDEAVTRTLVAKHRAGLLEDGGKEGGSDAAADKSGARGREGDPSREEGRELPG